MEEEIKRNKVILYEDLRRMMKFLTDEKAGILIRAIFDYAYDQVEPSFDDPLLGMAFEPVRTQLDRDWKKYLEQVKRNRENGKKGGRPPKEEKTPDEDYP